MTPWSPLKSGALSGKYTRENAETHKSDRGWMMPTLTEKEYLLLDEMKVIAELHDTTVAGVALAWLQAQPGVSSTIIGARRIEQLDQNLAALSVALTPEEVAKLSELTKPKLDFPYDFNQNLSPHLRWRGQP